MLTTVPVFSVTRRLMTPLTQGGTCGALVDGLELGALLVPDGVLAEVAALGIDIHLHDEGSLGTWELGLICDLTETRGLQGSVTVSHAYGLGEASPAEQEARTGADLNRAAQV